MSLFLSRSLSLSSLLLSPMASSSRLCFFLVLSLATFSAACTGRRCGKILIPLTDDQPCHYNAIYNFGDSISDTGNLVRQGGGSFATVIGQLPYGESINDPTGRCSDGHLIIDDLANAFNLPYLSPYLDKSAKFDHGVNFAVAGATALDPSFFSENNIVLPYTKSSLDVQLGWFDDHLKYNLCPSQEDCPKKLEKSLFFVGEIGGNDYNYALMQGKSIDEVKTYVPEVVGNIMDATQHLIDAGAIQIIVPGNFPIGCTPGYLTVFGGSNSNFDERNCLKDLNDFADFHNGLLQMAIADISKNNPQVTISYADYYNTFLDLMDKADLGLLESSKSPWLVYKFMQHDLIDLLMYKTSKWFNFSLVQSGFDKGTLLKACCGLGGDYNFNSNNLCGNPGVSVCADPSKLISWDGIHLTQQAYEDITNQLLSRIGLLKKGKC